MTREEIKEQIRYLKEREVSEITNLALPTLRNYRVLGKGPDYLKVGRSVRYRMDDVIRFMERNRIEPRER
jgi:predicted DNA-binding transcriptional regulator AlpA